MLRHLLKRDRWEVRIWYAITMTVFAPYVLSGLATEGRACPKHLHERGPTDHSDCDDVRSARRYATGLRCNLANGQDNDDDDQHELYHVNSEAESIIEQTAIEERSHSIHDEERSLFWWSMTGCRMSKNWLMQFV